MHIVLVGLTFTIDTLTSTNPSSTRNSSRPQPNSTADRSSTRLERGGSAAQPHSEEFELADYTGIQERREKESRWLGREARRAEKIRRLDAEDEMKFSHSIQFNAVPDWSSHYIAYSNLKKLYVSAGRRRTLPRIQTNFTNCLKDLSARKDHPQTRRRR